MSNLIENLNKLNKKKKNNFIYVWKKTNFFFFVFLKINLIYNFLKKKK